MKSTNNKRSTFSMEDFEKGLMLAGLTLPNSISDLNDRAALDAYEKALKQQNKKTYFKRVVLAAEIAYQLHNERTFGRIKFQKLVYLCEHAAEMELHSRYKKQVAGPFDSKFMHTIETEFKKNKWFKVEKIIDGTITRTKYCPLDGVENYKGYFQSYFGAQSEAIYKLINLFRSVKTDTAEIAATLYASRIELSKSSAEITWSDLLEYFYRWSERKQQFDAQTVKAIWEWMVENGLVEALD